MTWSLITVRHAPRTRGLIEADIQSWSSVSAGTTSSSCA